MANNKALNNYAFLFAVFSAAVYFFSYNRIDPDLWGHITFGGNIVEHLSIPRVDIYSYSYNGMPWINHEWLAESIFYWIFRSFANAGLIIFKAIIGICTVIPLYLVIRRKAENIFLQALVFFAMWVMAYGFSMRPHIFTFLFFAWEAYLLDRYDDTGDRKYLLPIPVIMLAWVNLHGGFIIGVILAVLYFFCRLRHVNITEVGVAVFLSIQATFINPYGAKIWDFISSALLLRRPHIVEWSMIEVTGRYFPGYAMLFIFMLAAILFAKRKRRIYDMAVLIFGFWISFMQSRHVAIFAIIAGIYLPVYIDSFAKGGSRVFEKGLFRSVWAAICISVGIAFLLSAFYLGKTNAFEIEIPADQYPVSAVRFMQENKIDGNLLPWFDWAEMCIRELPQSRVFFDGRYETVYKEEFISGYFDLLLCKNSYRDYLKRFPETDIIFINKRTPLRFALLADREWILVYSEGQSLIWLKDNEHNKPVIEKFKKGELLYPKSAPPYYFR